MRKKIVTAALLLVLVLSMALSVSASNGSVQQMLHYRDIKLTLNGQEFTPTDADGNIVEPFIIDGTTYLPVRAVSGALGLNVEWDDVNSTVVLSEPVESRPVYITKSGSRYHHNSTCNGGTYWEVPYSTAIGMGLTPCDKCVLLNDGAEIS